MAYPDQHNIIANENQSLPKHKLIIFMSMVPTTMLESHMPYHDQKHRHMLAEH